MPYLVEKSKENVISFERFQELLQCDEHDFRSPDGYGFDFYEEDEWGFGWTRFTFSEEELPLYQQYLREHPEFLQRKG